MIKRTVVLWVACLLVLLPIAVLGLWSLSVQWIYPNILPSQAGLGYFQQAAAEPDFWPSILNSTFIALLVTLLTLLISLPAAKFFARQTLFSKRLTEFIIYLPLILPAIAIITSTQFVFIKWHLTGGFTGIVLMHTYFTLPYALQILLESYRKMGSGYQNTAKILGASPWYTFTRVTYPLLKPGILTAAGLIYIVSFSQYLPTFFIGDGKIMTLPLILLPYANNGRFGIASVYSLVFIVVCVIGVGILKLILGGRHGLSRESR